jgi:hypothetical protein
MARRLVPAAPGPDGPGHPPTEESSTMIFRGAKWTTDRILSRINGRRTRSLTLYDTRADDQLLITLAELGDLTSLEVSSAFITDDGVRALVGKCPLRSLFFRSAPLVTDRSLMHISKCISLHELYLEGTAVSDDGVGVISELPNLWSLNVSRTRITDIGIRRIASTRINLVSYDETAITGVGLSTWSVKEKMSFYTNRSMLNDEGYTVACNTNPTIRQRTLNPPCASRPSSIPSGPPESISDGIRGQEAGHGRGPASFGTALTATR